MLLINKKKLICEILFISLAIPCKMSQEQAEKESLKHSMKKSCRNKMVSLQKLGNNSISSLCKKAQPQEMMRCLWGVPENWTENKKQILLLLHSISTTSVATHLFPIPHSHCSLEPMTEEEMESSPLRLHQSSLIWHWLEAYKGRKWIYFHYML